ncbi:hypothetical protein pb186bvf_005305 [Paramecium bursaria]
MIQSTNLQYFIYSVLMVILCGKNQRQKITQYKQNDLIIYKQILKMQYKIPEQKNLLLAQRIEKGEMQGGFLWSDQHKGKYVIQNRNGIEYQFTFYVLSSNLFLQASFLGNNLINWKILSQLAETQQYFFDVRHGLDTIIDDVNKSFLNTQSDNSQDDNILQRRDYEKFQRDVIESFLNRKFMEDKAIQQYQEAKQKASNKAKAETNIKFAQSYLDYFNQQEGKLTQLDGNLQNIFRLFQEDFEIYQKGYKFVKDSFENLQQFYNNKSWFQDSQTEQFKGQMNWSNPFFQQLNQKYFNFQSFDLDLDTLNQYIKNKRQIQQAQIELQQKIAEKQFNEFFLDYWNKQLIEANRILLIYRNYDKAQKLKECHQHINMQVIKIQEAYNSIRLNMNKSYSQNQTYVSFVSLEYKTMFLDFQNSDQVIDSEGTLKQIQIVNGIISKIKYYEQEINKIEILKQRLKDLEQEPNEIINRKEENMKIMIIQVENQKNIFQATLNLQLNVNFEELYLGRQGFQSILGAFRTQLVIRDSPCCLGCYSRKKLHEAYDIFQEDFEVEVAAIIRH